MNYTVEEIMIRKYFKILVKQGGDHSFKYCIEELTLRSTAIE